METGRTHAISFRFALQPLGRSAAVNGGSSAIAGGLESEGGVKGGEQQQPRVVATQQSERVRATRAGRQQGQRYTRHASYLDLTKYHGAC